MKQLLPIALSLLMLPMAHAEPIPPVETFVLENGLTVLLREDHSVPLVAIQFRSRAGAILDPAGKEGVASLTADLLNYGTATRSEDQISDETARLGAVLSAGAGTESFVISGNVPTIADGALQRFIALFADVALHPSFPEEAFERAKALRIGALRGLVDDRAALASRAFSGFVFADHPYGRSVGGTLPSVTSITRSDLAAFHAQMVLPEETLIGVAGDFDAAEMKTALTDLFAHSWGGSRCVRAQSEGLCTAYRLADGEDLPVHAETGESGVLIGTKLAERLEVGLGDPLWISRPRRPGKKVCEDGVLVETEAPEAEPLELEFTISGVLTREQLGRRSAGMVVVMDFDLGERLYAGVHIDRRWWARRDAGVDVERLKSTLARTHSYELNKAAVLGQAADERAFRTGVNMAGLMALLLGLYVIFHTLSMSLTERLREVGTLHALGTTRAQVGRIFLLEAVMLAGSGAAFCRPGGSVLHGGA